MPSEPRDDARDEETRSPLEATNEVRTPFAIRHLERRDEPRSIRAAVSARGHASAALARDSCRDVERGNKSKFIPRRRHARGLEKGLERATAAIARAPSHDWKPKAPDANLKSQWIVDAPRAGASDRDGVSGASGGIGAHLELEQMVSAGRPPAAASVGAGGERDSSDYASSSDESRSASRRRREEAAAARVLSLLRRQQRRGPRRARAQALA